MYKILFLGDSLEQKKEMKSIYKNKKTAEKIAENLNLKYGSIKYLVIKHS